MASAMGYKIVLLWVCFIGITSASVELTGKWIEKFGFEINCSWHTNDNDTLQSVRLFRNDRQYLVHRPEIHDMQQNKDERSLEFRLKVTCRLGDPRGKTGHCVTTVELFKPATRTADLYRCDVSGERPTFKQESQEFEAFVQPSETKLKDVDSGKYLNCTSEGLPPPQLVWTTDQGQKVPEIFKSASWNSYKKLWLSWSTVEVQGSSLKCTAQLSLRNGTIVVANGATSLRHSNGPYFVIYGTTHLVVATLFSSVFFR